MNDIFKQVRHRLHRLVTDASALVDPPLAPDARPIEIQDAIVAEVERRAEPTGTGRRVLPCNHVSVTVLAATAERRAALQAGLGDLRQAVCDRLREIRCEVPPGFDVSVRYAKQPLQGWSPDQQLSTAFSTRGGTAALGRTMPPPLHVTVLRGRTPKKSYTLTEWRVQIGRSAEPVDAEGRVRQNHIAFVEEEQDEHSRTVGRAHASICYEPARGAYQLFDDGSRNGTRVIRGTTTFEVVRRDPVGVTIRSGDEIQLGTAAIRVQVADA